MFINNRLRVIDENIEVQEENQKEVNSATLDKELMQAIVCKEDITAADASLKERKMERCCRIEDVYECVSACDSARSRRWRENSALAAEELIVIDLVDTVMLNMKGAEEGKIAINMDCRKV